MESQKIPTTKRKRYQKDSAPADDILTLIRLVRQNPALYNYKLSPNQRRRSEVLNGWSNVATKMGNKYSVEECRRKWKNLRDTYHQYRLRKPRFGDGLQKWRYAKELEFLSNCYQPKLKIHRHMSIDALQDLSKHDMADHEHTNDGIVHHSEITLVNDDAEEFILTAYAESDPIEADTGEDPNMAHMHHLSHADESVEDVEEIVKHEQPTSMDAEGTVAEVDYEVCMYDEGSAQNVVDNETIITEPQTIDTKFQYIDANDFCISTIDAHGNTHPLATPSSINNKILKLTNATSVVSTSITVSTVDTNTTTTVATPAERIETIEVENDLEVATVSTECSTSSPNKRVIEELDLFFDFMKKKMQRFPEEEITLMQLEFLNCVLKRETKENVRNK